MRRRFPTFIWTALLTLSQPLVAQKPQKPTVADLQSQIEELRLEVFTLQSATHESVILDATSRQGFQRLDTDMGPIFVVVKDATVYVDGFKVLIWLGNPGTASLSDASLHVKWGPSFKGFKGGWAAWQKSLRSRDFPVNKDLLEGTWTPLELILTPAKPEEIAWVSVSVSVGGIRLREPQSP